MTARYVACPKINDAFKETPFKKKEMQKPRLHLSTEILVAPFRNRPHSRVTNPKLSGNWFREKVAPFIFSSSSSSYYSSSLAPSLKKKVVAKLLQTSGESLSHPEKAHDRFGQSLGHIIRQRYGTESIASSTEYHPVINPQSFVPLTP